MAIVISGVEKSFGAFRALKHIDLEVKGGELMALLGPSGSGKTTLLRIIAGLELADVGRIEFSGQDMARTSARERRVGFVFQHYALFRHMTVLENVSFGLKVKPRAIRPPKEVIRARAMELLRLVQLDFLADRYPNQLSGGQRQRVALARAIAIEPQVLLLDEPFGALDAKVRKELRRWLRRLHDEMGLTSIFVTHDQEEALELADRVVVMSDGRVEQVGTPQEVYERPATPFVFDFLGNTNRFECRIEHGQAVIGRHVLPVPEHRHVVAGRGLAYVRPHDVEIQTESGEGIPATVRHIFAAGPTLRIELEAHEDGKSIEAEMPRHEFDASVEPGRSVRLMPRHVTVFVLEHETRAIEPAPAE